MVPAVGLTGAKRMQTYTVKAGDTLARIAATYYGSATAANIARIAEANGIANPNLIRIGQRLSIPEDYDVLVPQQVTATYLLEEQAVSATRLPEPAAPREIMAEVPVIAKKLNPWIVIGALILAA